MSFKVVGAASVGHYTTSRMIYYPHDRSVTPPLHLPVRKKDRRLSKQKAVYTAIAAAVTAVVAPAMSAQAETLVAQMKVTPAAETPVAAPAAETPVAAPAEAPAPAAAPQAAPAAEVPADVSATETPVAAPVSEPGLAADPLAPAASDSVLTTPVVTEKPSDAKVAGPGFSMPNLKLPFSLSLSYRPETATLAGTGFTGSGTPAVPTQFSYPTANGMGWSGTAEIGIPFITLGARTTSYGALGNYGTYDNSSIAASQPYYWPEGAFSAYVKALGLRFGYLSEQFNASTGHQGAVGSLVGGLDSGFSLFGLIGVDYHVLGGWGVSGQNVGDLKTSHVPVEGDASVYVNLGPVNLRAGYVARATFTGDPASFLTVFTNPAAIATEAANGNTTTMDTVNATRLGTYMGPYFGAGFNF